MGRPVAGHWDVVTPGYGGYLSNVIEAGWNSLKHSAVSGEEKRDVGILVLEISCKPIVALRSGKYTAITHFIPLEPMQVYILGAGPVSAPQIDVAGDDALLNKAQGRRRAATRRRTGPGDKGAGRRQQQEGQLRRWIDGRA